MNRYFREASAFNPDSIMLVAVTSLPREVVDQRPFIGGWVGGDSQAAQDFDLNDVCCGGGVPNIWENIRLRIKPELRMGTRVSFNYISVSPVMVSCPRGVKLLAT